MNIKIQFSIIFYLLLAYPVYCANWPMWRCDSGHNAATSEILPEKMDLLWERIYSPRTPVWDDPLNQDLMPYDKGFEPVVMGKRIFIPFNDCDKVVALDTESGEELWAFYTEGPVRFPPVAWQGKVYFTSDDGCLYCVDATTGRLVWKFRGGPSERKIIGNKRLISTWPARGGPVIVDSTVYFAAGIWPFMGTFIYALDAETGSVKWINDRTGSEYILQPHDAPSFAGVAPQGTLAAAGNYLLVPGGRSVPACFDRKTGEELYFRLAECNKTGGSFVSAAGDIFFNHYREQVVSMYDLSTGVPLIPEFGCHPVITKNILYLSGKHVSAYDFAAIQKKSRWQLTGWFWERTLARAIKSESESASGLAGKLSSYWRETARKLFRDWFERKREEWKKSFLWEIPVDGSLDLIKAGNCLYAAGPAGITAIDLTKAAGEKPQAAWTISVDQKVCRLIAADNKLFAVTRDGRIMAFGTGAREPKRISSTPSAAKPAPEALRKAQDIVRRTGIRDGYALCYGAGDKDFLAALALCSGLKIVAVDPDSELVASLRRHLDSLGLYGDRISVLCSDSRTFALPPYMASLIIVDNPGALAVNRTDKAGLEKIFRSLRPYGGKAWLAVSPEKTGEVSEAIHSLNLANLRLSTAEGALVLSREGPLPGAADWTHQYGSPANTVKSDDSLVRLPLGVLWFGGSSNLDVLPRHAHGPAEQVIGGRLFIEGMDCLSARDVYTGRVLWKAPLAGLGNYGIYYNSSYQDAPTSTEYNQEHIPGANIRGTNFVATQDRIYVIEKDSCRVLDTSSGKTVKVISLPKTLDPKDNEWGYIGVYGDILLAGEGLVTFSADYPRDKKIVRDLANLPAHKRESRLAFTDFDRSASKTLTAMDRFTGKFLWQITANQGFLHNAIAMARDKVFCLDKLPPYIENQLKRRGAKAPLENYRLLALDLRTGQVLWEKRDNVFGSWLAVSTGHDILLESTRPSSDMVFGEEGERMAAFRSSDGTLIWDKKLSYNSVPILHGGRIITQGKMFSLLDGKELSREHPLTGERIRWSWRREYGCNYPIACENLISFRSGAAGFYDLANDGGTGNLGGFKSGCTSTLVAADGVLNAPDYTRTCSCSYQNQTSLALIHDPDVEIWTFNDIPRGGEPVKRVGINFGAPGDRVDNNGTLWLDYPSRGGPSPDIPITTSPKNPEWYCHHSSRIESGGLKWVAASGVKGLRSVTLTLSDRPWRIWPYTVRLYFAEDDDLKPGERVFDVVIQGEPVLQDFDIVREAGAPHRVVVKEFGNILAGEKLTVSFIPSRSASNGKPLVSGLEVLAGEW